MCSAKANIQANLLFRLQQQIYHTSIILSYFNANKIIFVSLLCTPRYFADLHTLFFVPLYKISL